MVIVWSSGCATAGRRPRAATDGLRAAQAAPAVFAEELPLASHPVPAPEPGPVEPDAVEDEEDDDDAVVVDPGVAEISPLAGIPLESNASVEKWIQFFTVKDRERFSQFLGRGGKYKEVVESILEQNGVPAELFYLAMIESGYQTRATSRASAVGVWQFIHATGKRYGLDRDAFVDERRDPIRATEAAARYLRDLYNVFASWHLALAAYNSGEFRIMNAIIRGKSRDFWQLKEKGVLPRETSEYVPKFFAAVTIGQSPEKYGFSPVSEEKYPDLEAVEVPGPVMLKDVARIVGMPAEDLEKVNPHLHRGMTPPGSKNFEIWVPQSHAAAVAASREQISSVKVKKVRTLASAGRETGGRHYYHVKRGDSLGSIARRAKTSVAFLKRINGLRSTRVHVGQTLRLDTKTYVSRRPPRHRVQAGESLTLIARRYGTSAPRLKRLNSLRSDRIRPGMSLRLP